MSEDVGSHVEADSVRTHALVCYGLMVLSMLTGGIAGIVGLIWAYVKKGDAVGTIYESHFANIISTFWIGLVLGIIAVVTLVFVVGYLIAIAAAIYCLYRFIKGIIRTIDRKAYA
ncbi:DUF4870 family protein [Vibrio hippocampi]|uniref:DUF4870 domain-containing protein n=1 Tax=Vibrio hippocampi TaxID=654686 RepID=A0ABM8ZFT5_9VIBR|nr:hypothetical protein [Vibrio hippocampi]CAH0524936.1 hypothetical protein VHP8226_00612 [Vibrio hippocampi]